VNGTRDLIPLSADEDEPAGPVGPPPRLEDLSPEAVGRLVRYIVTSTLERGVAPNEVAALYADLVGDELAVRYADRRFMLREMPPDWSEIESRVLDLEQTARDRGLELAAAWRRAMGVAMQGQDPLEQLARLAGVRSAHRSERSIFDDPEDLDELEDDVDFDAETRHVMEDRSPDLLDLSVDAQQRLRRFAIEERLERGLPAVELLELYRAFELDEDERARQYLDLIYVDHEAPPDWLEVQSEAGRVIDLAEARGRDAGRMYADMLRSSPGIEPMYALRLLFERLLQA
jgi:hypothetical protein